jgi:hypothetical protein
MSHERTLSHTTEPDNASDIYQSPTADPRQLLGPGTPGGRHIASASGGATTETSAAPSTIGAPLPLIVELDSIVERFRGRQVSKPCAIGLISAKFTFDTAHAEPEKDNAFLQYLATIESIERLAVDATHRGANLQPDQSEPGPAHHSAQPPHGTNGEDTNGTNRGIVSGGDERHKRDRGIAEHPELDDEDEEADGTTPKRQRIFEKNMPWFHRETVARITANPSCLATRDILSQFAADFHSVKHWILSAQSAPRGFPSTEWDHIIKGKPVDLNVVLSSLHHVSPVKENIGRVGQTEISLGRTEPTRRVHTSGEWTSAWNATVKAYAFTFPHRENELKRYGDYIDREFSSKVVSAHRKVILYDTAVRNEVAGGSSILLTDRDEFSHIYSEIVLPDGIESEHGQGIVQSTTKAQSDTCRRFNSLNGCPNPASTCRYQHVCSKRRRRGHPMHECEKDNKANPKSTT